MNIYYGLIISLPIIIVGVTTLSFHVL